jgi:hypothetical protein
VDLACLTTSINLYIFGDRKGEGYFENVLKYHFWKAKLELGQTIVPEREIYYTALNLTEIGAWSTALKMYFDGLTKDFYGRAITVSYNSHSKCWYAEVAFREEWNARLQKNTFGIYPTFQVFFDETKRFGI